MLGLIAYIRNDGDANTESDGAGGNTKSDAIAARRHSHSGAKRA